MFREAFGVANAPRKGPVQLDLPRDILSTKADYAPLQSAESYRTCTAPAGEASVITRAAAEQCGASRPVIITRGVECAGRYVPQSRLCYPLCSALNAGQMGPRGNLVASQLVKEADMILALGTRIGFNATFYSYDNINRDAAIIQVE